MTRERIETYWKNFREKKRPKFWKFFLQGWKGTSTIYGNADFMSQKEQQAFFEKTNRGLVVGRRKLADKVPYRLSGKDSYRNLAMFAPTGIGKTTGFVIENILRCEGSAIITDPSGEIFDLTSGEKQKQGFDIKVLKPHDPDHSHRFNPFVYPSNHQQFRYLACSLAMEGATQRTEPIWINGPTDFFFAALMALKVGDKSFQNFLNLRWLINHYGVDGGKIAGFMAQLDDFYFSEYLAFTSQDQKLTSNIISSARSAFSLWSDPGVIRVTASDNMALASIRQQKTIIYLIVPEHLIAYYGALLKLFYIACFSLILEAGNQPGFLPVYFFLDEFGNMGEIPNFPAMATTLRKRECSLSIILQSLSQLEMVYGRDKAKTIFGGGMGNKLFLPGMDADTCKYLEDVLGKNTVYDSDTGGVSEYARTVGVPLMSRDEIRMMEEKTGILISGNQRPAKLRMKPFYEDDTLTTLTGQAPARLDFDYADEPKNPADFPLIRFEDYSPPGEDEV